MEDYSISKGSNRELDKDIGNKTFNYDAEIKAYPFDPQAAELMKKFNPGETTGLPSVLERVRSTVENICQRRKPMPPEV